ncbi:HET-domain-containing protein, partial [Setomelanomma holmii]
LRLVEKLPLEASYVALGHRWGQEDSEKKDLCTFGNIDSLLRGFSMVSMPLLYKDAVIMTQKLGTRYLWIDSLCIVQNSKEHWAYECACMAQVYANSYLTISAMSCRDSSQGFLEVQPDFQKLETGLVARGWAFQERLLSRRVLHFTSGDMVFECDYGTAYEGGLYSHRS